MASRFPWKSETWPPERAIAEEKTTEVEVTGTIVDAYSLNVRSELLLKGRMKNAQTADVNEQVKAIKITPTKLTLNGETIDIAQFYTLVEDFVKEANGGVGSQSSAVEHLWGVTDIIVWAPPHVEADLISAADSTDPLAPGGTISCLLRGKSIFSKRTTVTNAGKARNTKMKERAPVMVDDLLMGLVDKHPNKSPPPNAKPKKNEDVADDEW